MYVTKGVRVRAEWMYAFPIGTYSLAGAQPKVSSSMCMVEGPIQHIWSDDPTALVNVTLRIKAEASANVTPVHCDRCGCDEVEIKPDYVVGASAAQD